MTLLPISIIIPTYNRAHLICRAIDSAIVASKSGDEIIVVDDGSTDNTGEVLSKYGNMIRHIRMQNSGAGAARNRGVREAWNPLVAFLDSDDEWMPDKLHLQRALMESLPDVLFCFTNFAVRQDPGEDIHNYLINWHKDPRSWDEILGPGFLFSTLAVLPGGRKDFLVHAGDLYAAQMAAGYVFTSTLVVRKQKAGKALEFAEDLPVYEDWECYGKLAGAGTAAYLSCETAWNYGHSGERLTNANALICTTARIKLLERVWGRDEECLRRHGDRYRQLLADQHLLRAKELFTMGKVQEAKADLSLIDRIPLSYRLLASMPGAFAKWVLSVRRRGKALLLKH